MDFEREFEEGNPCGPFYDSDEHDRLDEVERRFWATITLDMAMRCYRSEYQEEMDDYDELKKFLCRYIPELVDLGYTKWEDDIIDWD